MLISTGLKMFDRKLRVVSGFGGVLKVVQGLVAPAAFYIFPSSFAYNFFQVDIVLSYRYEQEKEDRYRSRWG